MAAGSVKEGIILKDIFGLINHSRTVFLADSDMDCFVVILLQIGKSCVSVPRL